jgi:hypothetical protein
MSVQNILEALDREISKLSQARMVLVGHGSSRGADDKHVVSAASRRKMAAAQKKRWAAFRASKGQVAKAKVSVIQPKRMSPAARKRIAAAQRARWAKLRAGTKKAA